MNYRIVEKEAFTVVGKGLAVSCKNGDNFITIPAFWDECMADETFMSRIRPEIGELGIMGVIADYNPVANELSYMIAIEKTDTIDTSTLYTEVIPASTWLVIESIGPVREKIRSVCEQIQQWLPTSGFTHAGTAELEIYYPGDITQADYRMEIWIPVVERA